VRITVDGTHVAAVGVCHCSLCQRSSGLVWGAFEAAADAVTVTGTVTRYASTHFSERAFCPVCGSNLWLRNTDTEDAEYELMPALFPAARTFPLISEVYSDRAPAYARLTGDHRRVTRAEYEANQPHIEGDQP
jgi:hypothetical protein